VVLAAGGVAMGLLGDKGRDVGPEPAKVEELRPVVLQGLCPAAQTTEAAKCREAIQLDGRCLCLSAQKPGQVDGEVGNADALPAAFRTRLVACPGKDKAPPVVSWEKDAGEPRHGCVVAARPMVDVSLDAETDLVEQLRAACTPCPISGRAWGPCPHCLVTPGGCAEACRE
jgi:hypothetical protein